MVDPSAVTNGTADDTEDPGIARTDLHVVTRGFLSANLPRNNIVSRSCLIALTFAALTAASQWGWAGEFRFVRDHYSTTRPQPLIEFKGAVEKDDVFKLQSLIKTACKNCDEGNTAAILSLNSHGGDFVGGMALANTIRYLQIATVVENGNVCYSACALAFLGGSGFHPTGGIGVYVDRFMEPDAEIGFHAPPTADFSGHLSEEQKFDLTARDLRGSIANLVRFLIRYNVDPVVADRIILTAPDELYVISTFADLYDFRINLPTFPIHLVDRENERKILNVCSRLTSLHYSDEVTSVQPIVDDEFSKAVAHTRNSVPLDGFHIDDRPLNVAWCGLQNDPTSYDDLAERFTISLARMAWKADKSDAYAVPIVSFNYSDDAWNSAGYRGGTAARSILRLGPINHWFYEPELDISSLGRDARTFIEDDKRVFFGPFDRWQDRVLTGLDFQTFSPNKRVYRLDAIKAEVEAGPGSRFDHTFKRYQRLRNTKITYSRTFENAFVVSGLQPDARQAFYTFGLRDDDAALVATLEFPVGSDGKPPEGIARQIEAIACSATFGTARLPCN